MKNYAERFYFFKWELDIQKSMGYRIFRGKIFGATLSVFRRDWL